MPSVPQSAEPGTCLTPTTFQTPFKPLLVLLEVQRFAWSKCYKTKVCLWIRATTGNAFQDADTGRKPVSAGRGSDSNEGTHEARAKQGPCFAVLFAPRVGRSLHVRTTCFKNPCCTNPANIRGRLSAATPSRKVCREPGPVMPVNASISSCVE